MSTEVVQRTPQEELVAQVRSDAFREQVALALPENVTPERFVRVTVTALQSTPNLAELERASVVRSLLSSAAMGLLPDGREAAIVPFKGKAQLIAMVGGLRKIAAEYGWTIYTSVVHANDVFEYEQGLDVRFRHVPVRPGAEPGEVIAAYAVGKHADGRRELEVLTVAEIEKIRAVSQSAQSKEGPWANWWEQMAEKSAAKRLFKQLPLSDDDKRVRVVRTAIEPTEAAAALYGATRAALPPAGVDPATGEVLPSGAIAATADRAGAALPLEGDAAAGAPSEPEAAPAPDDDVEPEVGTPSLGSTKIPTGPHKGKTLAAMGEADNGWEWLAWATKDERPWNREGDRNAAFGEAVRQYVSERTS
jgi:recombination protein RecT